MDTNSEEGRLAEQDTKTAYCKIRVKKRLQREMAVREGGERQRQEDGAKAGIDRSETIHFR